MTWWPFRSVRVQVLEREQLLLQARIRDLEAQLARERDETIYFRTRYERVADLVLMRQGDVPGPVHVDAPPPQASLASKVARISTSIGSLAGIKPGPSNASIAELPR